ncbi:hypothetical protein [Nocardia sp. NPDC056000]
MSVAVVDELVGQLVHPPHEAYALHQVIFAVEICRDQPDIELGVGAG